MSKEDNDKKYDYVVFMGRFQPPHNAHIEILNKAFEVGKEVIVLIGSAGKPVTIKNPFNDADRALMISMALGDINQEYLDRLNIKYVNDFMYSDTMWINHVNTQINSVTNGKGSVALIGHHKDDSSFYLDSFPQYDYIEVENTLNNISSTFIRNGIFEYGLVFDELPNSIKGYIRDWMASNRTAFRDLVAEWSFIKDYKQQWSTTPHPVLFVTVDAVVVQSGHVLLVKRKAYPGKGLWALPGGFLDENETIKDGIIRELKEETRISIPRKILKDKLNTIKIFDAPSRSLRGRTITHAGLIELDHTMNLPKVKGSDDAEKAKWVPISSITSSKQLYEDHYDIIQTMTGSL